MVEQGKTILPADFDQLFTLANGKPLAGDYGTLGKWLEEFNRLRKDLFDSFGVRPTFFSLVPPWPNQMYGDGVWPLYDNLGKLVSSEDDPKNRPAPFPFAVVSGEWPLNMPNPFSGTQKFFYPDTGAVESANMTRMLFAGWRSFGDDEVTNYYVIKNGIMPAGEVAGRFAIGLMPTKRKFAIVISGTKTIRIKAVVHIPIAYLVRGYTSIGGSQPIYDAASIFDLVNIDSTMPVPVEKIEKYNPSADYNGHYAPGTYSAFVFRMDGDYPIGRYEITLTVPYAGDDVSNYHNENPIDAFVKSRVDISADLNFGGKFEQPSEGAINAAGIHNAKQVKCISVTPEFPAICGVSGQPEVVKMFQSPIAATTDGYWLGYGYPVGNCFFPANNPNTPLRWAANTTVPTGCQIYDANGNIWTCTKAGVTAESELLAYYERGWLFYWPYALGSIYEEADIDGIPIAGAAIWKLTNVVRTRYETPWFSGNRTEPGSQAFIRRVGEICVSRGNDFYQCTRTQTMIDGVWTDTDTAIDGLASAPLNHVLDEPAWDRTIGNVTRLVNGALGTNYAVEWTSIFHAGQTVAQGQARVDGQIHSYPCIWDQDGWQASRPFNLGRKILAGGRIWVCSNSGYSGAIQPDFSGDAELADGDAKWQLESKVNYFGSEHKERYPRAAELGSGITQIWFIRQIYLNRVVHGSPQWSAGSLAGSAGGGFPNPETQNIPVIIGFYQNGAFVQLGQFMTGMSPIVNWPVFTDNPLVYRADERVDVQAMVVRPDGKYTNPDTHELTFPISAEHYNDVERSLNIL